MKLDIDLKLEVVAIETEAERRAWEAAIGLLAELLTEQPAVAAETEHAPAVTVNIVRPV